MATTEVETPIRAQARRLAKAHRDRDPKTEKVLLFEHAEPDTVCLLEVTGSVPTTGQALPFRFGPVPDEGFPFYTKVVLLSSEEWHYLEALRSSEQPMPEGWDLRLPEGWVPGQEEVL